jgi:hypothetical protein
MQVNDCNNALLCECIHHFRDQSPVLSAQINISVEVICRVCCGDSQPITRGQRDANSRLNPLSCNLFEIAQNTINLRLVELSDHIRRVAPIDCRETLGSDGSEHILSAVNSKAVQDYRLTVKVKTVIINLPLTGLSSRGEGSTCDDFDHFKFN